MKHALTLVICLLLVITAVSAQNDTIPLVKSGYHLAFHDEFSDTTLNRDYWHTYFPYTDDGSDQCAFCRTHGNENQIFLDRNLQVSNGLLHILLKKEDTVWFGERRPYTSGLIQSKQVFKQGRYEVRAKLPEGQGFWPAIWTYGKIYTEIDIMEAGMQNPSRYHISVHNWIEKNMNHKRVNLPFRLTDDFHVYAMEWDSTSLRFFIDDMLVWSMCKYVKRNGKPVRNCNRLPRGYRVSSVFPEDDERLVVIIGTGVGNESTPFTKSPAESTRFPNATLVDYVRIYQ